MKLDLGRAWNDAIGMISANKETVLVLAGVFFFLPYLVLMLTLPDMASSMQVQPGADSDAAMEQAMAMYADFWWGFLLLALLQGVGLLAGLALLGATSRPTVGEAIKAGVIGLLPYIGVQILQTLLFMIILGVPIGAAFASGNAVLGFVVVALAVVAFFYLFTKLSLAAPVIAIEDVLNPLKAMARSWRLTKGNSIRLFLFYALIFIAMFVVFMVISMIFGLIFALMGAEAMVIGNGIVGALTNAAMVMVFLAVLAAVHRQLAGPSPEALSETFE